MSIQFEFGAMPSVISKNFFYDLGTMVCRYCDIVERPVKCAEGLCGFVWFSFD